MDEEFNDINDEFTVLQNASKVYRESGNERIKSQHLLNCWDDTTNLAFKLY